MIERPFLLGFGIAVIAWSAALFAVEQNTGDRGDFYGAAFWSGIMTLCGVYLVARSFKLPDRND